MSEQWYEIELKGENRINYVKASNSNAAKEKFVQRKSKEHYNKFDETRIIEVRKSNKVSVDEVVKKLHKARYSVDVPWDYIESSLKRYFESYGLELEPDFQRAHVWTENQQVAYVEYVMRGGLSGKEIFFNEPNWGGNIVTEQMVLVDGLQRLTAVRKFMKDELKVFGNHVASDFQHLSMSECGFRFSINNLKTKKEVLEWYLDFNAAGTQHTKEELDKVKKLLENE